MRVAYLSDVHGNLPALEAVLAQLRLAAVDLVVVGGDVLPGPMPAECLSLLAALTIPFRCLAGNGERETLAAADGQELTTVPAAYQPLVRWSAAQLDAQQTTWLRQWPLSVQVEIAGLGLVLCCHATPRSDTEIVTRITPDARIAPAFDGVTSSLVVCGHTHMAFDRRIGDIRVVNAGSVGMPFGRPGAHWLLLDADGPRLMHTPYDVEAAAARIAATAYPGAADFAAQYVLNPPTEEAMLALFERG